jgi:hypothetical protein
MMIKESSIQDEEVSNLMSTDDAVELATKILEVDDSIISVGIVSNTGVPLGAKVRPIYQKKLAQKNEFYDQGAFPKLWGKQAFRVATITGSANADPLLLSNLESVVEIREKWNVLMVRIPSKEIIISLLTIKRDNLLELTKRIREFFGMPV